MTYDRLPDTHCDCDTCSAQNDRRVGTRSFAMEHAAVHAGNCSCIGCRVFVVDGFPRGPNGERIERLSDTAYPGVQMFVCQDCHEVGEVGSRVGPFLCLVCAESRIREPGGALLINLAERLWLGR